MSLKFTVFYSISLSFLLLSSCTSEPIESIPDVSNIEVDLKMRHFEKDFFALDTNDINSGLSQLEAQYPVFGSIYFEHILGSKNSEDGEVSHEAYVKGFLTFPSIRQLYDTCMIVFDDFEEQSAEFEQAFRYMKHYFPDMETPDVTTFTSEYNMAAFIYGENSLAVGLDFFLGSGYPYFQYNPGNASFSAYLTHSFAPEYLATKTLQVWIEDLAGQVQGNRLLDNMVHNGKKLYILDKLFPHKADSILLEIPQRQVEWMGNNEGDMWAFFLSENLLYSSDFSKIKKYITASPNSPGMPEEAPGKTGNWLGWQIIKQYMRRNPQTTLYDLLELRDAQVLLEQARYKPRKG